MAASPHPEMPLHFDVLSQSSPLNQFIKLVYKIRPDRSYLDSRCHLNVSFRPALYRRYQLASFQQSEGERCEIHHVQLELPNSSYLTWKNRSRRTGQEEYSLMALLSPGVWLCKKTNGSYIHKAVKHFLLKRSSNHVGYNTANDRTLLSDGFDIQCQCTIRYQGDSQHNTK